MIIFAILRDMPPPPLSLLPLRRDDAAFRRL